MIRVIGVGSPFGDDRVGLEVAARLAAAPAPGVEVILADRPGADLLELLGGAEAAIVIDAVRSGATVGTVHDLELRTPLPACLAPVSSHGLGVGEALALAAQLECLPHRGRLIGIEASAGRAGPAHALSPAVAVSIDDVVGRIRAWIERFDRAARSPRGAAQ